MDTTSGGIAGKLTLWGSLAVVCLAILGGVGNAALKLADIDTELDRNCRILASIQANARFIILEIETTPVEPGVGHGHSSAGPNTTADNFRQIFQATQIEACG